MSTIGLDNRRLSADISKNELEREFQIRNLLQAYWVFSRAAGEGHSLSPEFSVHKRDILGLLSSQEVHVSHTYPEIKEKVLNMNLRDIYGMALSYRLYLPKFKDMQLDKRAKLLFYFLGVPREVSLDELNSGGTFSTYFDKTIAYIRYLDSIEGQFGEEVELRPKLYKSLVKLRMLACGEPLAKARQEVNKAILGKAS